MITVHLASHPPRKAGMLRRVQEILPQLGPDDRMRVWLNNYPDSILDELPRDPRLVIVLAGHSRAHPDMRSFGKLADIESVPEYLLTIDDDIYYPRGYVQYMVEGVKRYQGMAIVTIHGGSFRGISSGRLASADARSTRENIEYYRGRGEVERCHTCGMGVSALSPRQIGMRNDINDCRWESGDDESVAVWAQRHEIPIIRLPGEANWVMPDDEIHTILPHYANIMGVCLANEKLYSWNNWHYPGIPPPRSPTDGPSMFHKALSPELRAQVLRTLSPDALAALVADALAQGHPLSVIRASDGERMFVKHAQGSSLNGCVQGDEWRNRYGTARGDQLQIGRDVVTSIQQCDVYCPTTSGWWMEGFDTWSIVQRDGLVADHCFHYAWQLTGRWTPVLALAREVMVLHRDAVALCAAAELKWPGVKWHPVVMTGCHEHASILEQAKRWPAALVVGSGGPSGKLFFHRLSRVGNRVVLDVGEALAVILSQGD